MQILQFQLIEFLFILYIKKYIGINPKLDFFYYIILL